MAAGGHRADVDVAVEGVVLHPHPVAEQRAAGERRGRVDREHADPLALLAELGHQRVGRGRLAHAGRAGDADDLRVAGVRAERRHHLAQQRRLVLDQRDQPRDRAGVALTGLVRRAHRDRSRATERASAPQDGGRHAHDQRVALTAATTQGGRADAAAAALELERQVQHDPGAGHADRVAQRDRAAVDVDLGLVEARGAGGVDADRRERLVELDQVEVGGRDALLVAGLLGGVGGLHLQRRVGAGDHAVGADLGQPLQAELLGLGLAHHHDGAGAVGDLRGGAGGDGAVLGERRAQRAERLGGGVAAHALVLGDHDRVALALRDRDRHDLVVEDAVLPGLGGLLVRGGRELVLLLAGQAWCPRRCTAR